MADQSERIILETPPDRVVSGIKTANQAIDSYEKKATSAAKNVGASTEAISRSVVTVSDRSQNAINRQVAATEKRIAALQGSAAKVAAIRERELKNVAGDSVATLKVQAQHKIEDDVLAQQRLNAALKEEQTLRAKTVAQAEAEVLATKSQMEQLLARRTTALKNAAGNPDDVRRVTAAYDTLIEKQKATALSSRAVADAIRNPLNAAGNAVEAFAARFGTVGIVAGGTALAVGLAAKETYNFLSAAADAAEQTLNLADRLGITVEEASVLEGQARITGVGVDGLVGIVRTLSNTLADSSVESRASVEELESLGIKVVDATGKFRNPIDILRDFSEHLTDIPDHVRQVASVSQLFGKMGIEMLPTIKGFAETERAALAAGAALDGGLKKQLAAAGDEMDALGISSDHLRLKLSKAYIWTVKLVTEAADPLVSPNAPGTKKSYSPGMTAGGPLIAFTNYLSDTFDPKPDLPNPPAPLPPHGAPPADPRAIAAGDRLVDQFRSRATADLLKQQIADITKRQSEVQAGIQKGATDDVIRERVSEFDKLTQKAKALSAQLETIEAAPAKAQAAAKATQDQRESATDLLNAALEKQLTLVEQVQVKYDQLRAKTSDPEALSILNRAQGADQFEALVQMNEQASAAEQKLKDEATRKQKQADDDQAASIRRNAELRADTAKQGFAIDEQGIKTREDADLRSLEATNATSIEQKIEVERRKAEIEQDYLNKSLETKKALLNLDEGIELQQAADDADQKLLIQQKYELLRKGAALKTQAEIDESSQNASIKSAEIIRTESQRQFDELHRQAEGIFDSLIRNWNQGWKGAASLFQTLWLTAIKNVATSAIANILGAAGFGGNGGRSAAGGRAGLGALLTLGTGLSVFGQGGFLGGPGGTSGFSGPVKPSIAANLPNPVKLANPFQPNGLGDVRLVDGAVPVVIQGVVPELRQKSQEKASGGGTLGAILDGVGLGSIRGSSQKGPIEKVESSIDFGDGLESLGGTITPGSSSTSTVEAGASSTSGTGGLLGNLKQQALQYKDLLGKLGDLGRGTGMVPKGIGGVTGGAMLLGGGALAFDGVRRGGVVGLGETTAGGALIGAKFGGPLGAVIGGGIGAAVGLIGLFRTSAESKIVDKVEKAYGIKISKSFAKSPLLDMIRQNFGGNIDVGIQSPQIRELIELYAMSTGQNSNGVNPHIQGVTFSNVNGQLAQVSTYRNGQESYTGEGGLATNVMPAPLQSQNVIIQSVQLKVGDGGVGALMDGRAAQVIQSNVRDVARANLDGQRSSSVGRRASAALAIRPNFRTT